MRAMVLREAGMPLALETRPTPEPGPGQVRLRVLACAVCRTDLHVVDGELPDQSYPRIPGHEVAGIVEAVGAGADAALLGHYVGAAWLARTCGHCEFCLAGQENLCEEALFNGYTRDGGFATHMLADADYLFALPRAGVATHVAPWLCAGLIGWRALRAAGNARRVGIYGFGSAAQLVTQVCRRQQREVYAFTRPGDAPAQRHALALGADWAGDSSQAPPALLDGAIIFAPVGALVPRALQAVRRGGRVVCAGIHMSDIPAFPYRLLWGERAVSSVANLTREDGREFLGKAAAWDLRTDIRTYRLEDANRALDDLREGRIQATAVLVP